MIHIEKQEVVGWEPAIRGMRNPMDSWDKSDSKYGCRKTGNVRFCVEGECSCPDIHGCYGAFAKLIIGENDLDLMKRLRDAGTDHRKFMRMIVVYCDITAPLYWWKEFDTYRHGVEKNSCSTMHRIHAKRFTLEDFSHENLVDEPLAEIMPGVPKTLNLQSTFMLEWILTVLNTARDMFLDTKDKKYWETMIQLLPTSYNQKRTVMMSYEALANMYNARKNHKLDEWRQMCMWMESLPYAFLITGKDGEASG